MGHTITIWYKIQYRNCFVNTSKLVISKNISQIHLFGTGSRGQRLLNSQNLSSSFLSSWFLWGTWIVVHVNQMRRPSPPLPLHLPHDLVLCGPFPYYVPCFFWWDLFSVPYIELNVSPRFQSHFVTWFKCTRGYFYWISSFHCASRYFFRYIPVPHSRVCHVPHMISFRNNSLLPICRANICLSEEWDMVNYISSGTKTEVVKIRYEIQDIFLGLYYLCCFNDFLIGNIAKKYVSNINRYQQFSQTLEH
jgi:hypothetical protein